MLPAGAEAMTMEKAIDQVFFSRVITCYQKIDADTVVRLNTGKRLSKEESDALFESEVPPRPSRKQFQLLQSVMQEMQVKRMQELNDEMPGGIGIIGRSLTTSQKALYVLLIGVLLVAVLYWVSKRLFTARAPRMRERTDKGMRKVMKAQMRLDKKRS